MVAVSHLGRRRRRCRVFLLGRGIGSLIISAEVFNGASSRIILSQRRRIVRPGLEEENERRVTKEREGQGEEIRSRLTKKSS